MIKPIVHIKRTLFNLPIGTIKRVRQEYEGHWVEVDRKGEIIKRLRSYNPSKKKISTIRAKLSHARTHDYIKGVLRVIAKEAENDKVERIAKKAIEELNSKEYAILD